MGASSFRAASSAVCAPATLPFNCWIRPGLCASGSLSAKPTVVCACCSAVAIPPDVFAKRHDAPLAVQHSARSAEGNAGVALRGDALARVALERIDVGVRSSVRSSSGLSVGRRRGRCRWRPRLTAQHRRRRAFGRASQRRRPCAPARGCTSRSVRVRTQHRDAIARHALTRRSCSASSSGRASVFDASARARATGRRRGRPSADLTGATPAPRRPLRPCGSLAQVAPRSSSPRRPRARPRVPAVNGWWARARCTVCSEPGNRARNPARSASNAACT